MPASTSVAEVPAFSTRILTEHVLGDENAVNLIWSVGNPQGSCRMEHPCEREVVRYSCRSPHLDRPVDNSRVRSGHKDLDCGYVCPRALHSLVDLLCGSQRHE